MIGDIENAMLARLKAAADAGVLGYRWRTLETYPAEWDDYLRDKVPNAPGAWVVFAGLRDSTSLGFGRIKGTAHFGLVVMAENVRNETATRHGDGIPAEPGSYQLIIDAIKLLHGWTPDAEGASALMVRSIHAVRTQAIVKARKISMFAAEFTMDLTISSAAPIGSLDDFKTMSLNWDIPPFGGVSITPGDPNADAADLVQLQTES